MAHTAIWEVVQYWQLSPTTRLYSNAHFAVPLFTPSTISPSSPFDRRTSSLPSSQSAMSFVVGAGRKAFVIEEPAVGSQFVVRPKRDIVNELIVPFVAYIHEHIEHLAVNLHCIVEVVPRLHILVHFPGFPLSSVE